MVLSVLGYQNQVDCDDYLYKSSDSEDAKVINLDSDVSETEEKTKQKSKSLNIYVKDLSTLSNCEADEDFSEPFFIDEKASVVPTQVLVLDAKLEMDEDSQKSQNVDSDSDDSYNYLDDEKFKECPTIWRKYIEVEDFKPDDKDLVLCCYNCLGRNHLGDDCNRMRPRWSNCRDNTAFNMDNFPKPEVGRVYDFLGKTNGARKSTHLVYTSDSNDSSTERRREKRQSVFNRDRLGTSGFNDYDRSRGFGDRSDSYRHNPSHEGGHGSQWRPSSSNYGFQRNHQPSGNYHQPSFRLLCSPYTLLDVNDLTTKITTIRDWIRLEKGYETEEKA
ncbi:hypothetical protein AYI68_g1816 [Smittium mucronatum]|uniref:CCHC-type domain-containing protein n=1 Tax=Smittium mucronatum TaxID=133383 RepID=A0A1R0H4M9_9FUNG|nr:hypothetical protein AYI68_g1816 [Smittium mucronatum]